MCPAGLQCAKSIVKAGNRRWVWFAEHYLMSQISLTPKQNHFYSY